jgi:hypothetical protein
VVTVGLNFLGPAPYAPIPYILHTHTHTQKHTHNVFSTGSRVHGTRYNAGGNLPRFRSPESRTACFHTCRCSAAFVRSLWSHPIVDPSGHSQSTSIHSVYSHSSTYMYGCMYVCMCVWMYGSMYVLHVYEGDGIRHLVQAIGDFGLLTISSRSHTFTFQSEAITGPQPRLKKLNCFLFLFTRMNADHSTKTRCGTLSNVENFLCWCWWSF